MLAPNEPFNISSYIRSVLDRVGGEYSNATLEILMETKKDKKLWSRFVEGTIEFVVKHRVNDEIQRQRAAVIHAAEVRMQEMAAEVSTPEHRQKEKDKIDSLAGFMKFSLLDYPLKGGKLLGEAYPEDLQRDIDWHNGQAQHNIHSFRWLTKVQAEAKPGKPLKKSFTAQQLDKIFEEARHA